MLGQDIGGARPSRLHEIVERASGERSAHRDELRFGWAIRARLLWAS